MHNHQLRLLEQWSPLKDELDWVLATIVETDGSSYRKAGAMMLINSLGKYYGLLSGGCLESDIMRQSRKCMQSGQSFFVTYDMREEEDLAWQLGIGCGGMVKILLQPVTRNNNYLQLEQVLTSLEVESECTYVIDLQEGRSENLFYSQEQTIPRKIADASGRNIMVHRMKPPVHLAILGGGTDAIPLVNLASTLGWKVSVIDKRPSYARASEFSNATQIIKQSAEALIGTAWLNGVDAFVVMNHNVEMDAHAITLLASLTPAYVGLLGPTHRTDRVFASANVQQSDYPHKLANPVGLRLGGELPESIALSIISEIHATLHGADGVSISDRL